MKKYNCQWYERMNVDVEANNKKEAKEIIKQNKFDEAEVAAKIHGSISVIEMKHR